jgi:hypothetical protein
MIKNIISRLTMVKTSRNGFWDGGISNERVYYWKDYYFDVYIACSRWGYRIKLT